ncbi:hypothetical protein GCM10023324_20340 [Streptomyces youssoufiensis]
MGRLWINRQMNGAVVLEGRSRSPRPSAPRRVDPAARQALSYTTAPDGPGPVLTRMAGAEPRCRGRAPIARRYAATAGKRVGSRQSAHHGVNSPTTTRRHDMSSKRRRKKKARRKNGANHGKRPQS